MLITGGVQRTFIVPATGKKRTFSMANQRFACRLDIELCSGVFYGLRRPSYCDFYAQPHVDRWAKNDVLERQTTSI